MVRSFLSEQTRYNGERKLNVETFFTWLQEYIALPDALQQALEMDLWGNSLMQYGLFALVLLVAFFLSWCAQLAVQKLLTKLGSWSGGTITTALGDKTRFAIKTFFFAVMMVGACGVLTDQPTEKYPLAHWVHYGFKYLFGAMSRLAIFLLLYKVVDVLWNLVIQPWIDRVVTGKEARFFPVIYRVINTVLWLAALIYTLPVFGLDAASLVSKSLATEALSNTIAQYLAFIGLMLLTLLLARTIFSQIVRLLHHLQNKRRDTSEELDHLPWFGGLERPGLYLIILIGFRAAVEVLTDYVGGEHALVHNIASSLVNILLTADITWICLIATDKGFENFITPLVSGKETEFDAQLIPLARKFVKVGIGVVGMIFVIKSFGRDPASVLAGLGIGGVAIGFAAKDTLSPFISGIAIYLTRPYSLGDYIKIEDQFEGTVEDIGFRATTLKTKEGTTFITPNDKIINSPIQNLSKKGGEGAFDGIMLRIDIANNPAQRDESIQIFMDAVNRVEGADAPKVHFLEYGVDNIALYLNYWVKDPTTFYDVRHEIMMYIDDHMRDKMIHMSLPTTALSFSSYIDETALKRMPVIVQSPQKRD